MPYLRVGKLAVAPSPVDHVSLRNHFGLSLVLCEPDEPKALGVTGLGVPLDLKTGDKRPQYPAAFELWTECRRLLDHITCTMMTSPKVAK